MKPELSQRLWYVARAGWRPTLSWGITIGVLIQILVRPFCPHVIAQLDITELLAGLATIGGLAVLRSKDKKEGSDK